MATLIPISTTASNSQGLLDVGIRRLLQCCFSFEKNVKCREFLKFKVVKKITNDIHECRVDLLASIPVQCFPFIILKFLENMQESTGKSNRAFRKVLRALVNSGMITWRHVLP